MQNDLISWLASILVVATIIPIVFFGNCVCACSKG